MTGHTPGPWTCFYKHKYDEWHVSMPISGSSMRFGIFDDGLRSENPEADARLIATSPEMLEALKATTAHLIAAVSLLKRGSKKAAPSDTMFNMMIADREKAIEQGRAIISKAEGRS